MKKKLYPIFSISPDFIVVTLGPRCLGGRGGCSQRCPSFKRSLWVIIVVIMETVIGVVIHFRVEVHFLHHLGSGFMYLQFRIRCSQVTKNNVLYNTVQYYKLFKKKMAFHSWHWLKTVCKATFSLDLIFFSIVKLKFQIRNKSVSTDPLKV